MSSRDDAALRALRPSFTTESDARNWLLKRLATDRSGEPLSFLAESEKAELATVILQMHKTVFGVPLCGTPKAEPAGEGRAADQSIRAFLDGYLVLEEHFFRAIVQASRIGP